MLCTALAIAFLAAPALDPPGLDADIAARFATLALDCVLREYPNKVSHVLSGDADVAPPRELTPAFYGCYDWHSAVHGHWLLVRLCRLYPEAAFTSPARAALTRNLSTDNLRREVDYLRGEGRGTFERPYGLAWLLQLSTELHEWDDAQGRQMATAIEPLEREASRRLKDWFPKLSHPIRTGEHSQTAFAMGLTLDWARARGDAEMAALIERRSRDYYLADRTCALAYEPGGQDFLSPCLAEADLLRRVLDPVHYSVWLARFLPEIPLDGDAGWLVPAVVTDTSDGKLAHLDGLNLSRAWMLEGITTGLPANDPRIGSLLTAAQRHRVTGLAALTGAHYEGGHWLGSFATYLVSERGLRPSAR